MTKRKILVPVDGTERSMHSLDFIKTIFKPEDVKITIMNVKELIFIDGISLSDEIRDSETYGKRVLKDSENILKDFDVDLYFTFGYPGDEIIRKSEDEEVDIIVMTKSTKKGLTRMIGSVTTSVVKHAKCTVMIVPE